MTATTRVPKLFEDLVVGDGFYTSPDDQKEICKLGHYLGCYSNGYTDVFHAGTTVWVEQKTTPKITLTVTPVQLRLIAVSLHNYSIDFNCPMAAELADKVANLVEANH